MERIEPIRKLIKKAANRGDHPRQKKSKFPLTAGQVHAIDFLAEQPKGMVSQHQFNEEMNVQRSTMTVMLQRLEKKGLVTRIPDPSDKRQKLVALTPAGQALAPKLKELMIEDDRELEANFSKEELETVRKVLQYIIEEG